MAVICDMSPQVLLFAALSAGFSHAVNLPERGLPQLDSRQQEQQKPTTTHPAVQTLTPQLGQNVTLSCQIPPNPGFLSVKWTRPDLEPEYVIFLRDGQLDPDNQHSSFQNRVELQDLSLYLKNMSSSDYGTYECHVKVRKDGVVSETITTIITLTEPHEQQQITRKLIPSIVVGVVLVGAAVCIWKRCRKKNSDLPVYCRAAPSPGNALMLLLGLRQRCDPEVTKPETLLPPAAP